MGSIYLRGETYWVQYYRNGRAIRESAQTRKKTVALRFLESRMGDVADGRLPGIHFDRVTFDELAADFILDYQQSGRKAVNRAELAVKHLQKTFAGTRVPDITTAHVQAHTERRLGEGAAPATVNRELATLKRMLHLGAHRTPAKVQHVLYIPMLKEDNVRTGFFEHAEFTALREALPDHLKGFVTFAYRTGWRRGEIAGLMWAQVDLDQATVRLEPGTTKNDQGRTVYLDGELRGILEGQRARMKERRTLCPFVFPNEGGTGPLLHFRRSWHTACKKAGVGDRLFHDLRRTAIRNMIRSGIPERVAMMISGHKTRSVFDRYNIVSENDLKRASEMHDRYLDSRKADTKTDTILIFDPKRGKADEA